MVDGISVTNARNVTTPQTHKRYKRRTVTGAHGLEVNGAGMFYDKWGHPVEPHGNGKYKCLINPGEDYSGPVWPAHGNMFGQYLADVNAGRDRKAERITEYDRVAAELVAYEFLGSPPASWEYVTVVHRDGDRNNRHPDNLFYAVNELAILAAEQTTTRALMRGPVTGARLGRVVASDPYGTTTRNPYGTTDGKRREGADLTRNPQYLPDKPRTLERAS